MPQILDDNDNPATEENPQGLTVDAEDEDTEPAEDSAEDSDWTPPSKEDWVKVNEALRKARQDARAAKRAKNAPSAEGEKNPEDVEAEITGRVEAKYKGVVVRQAARAAFAEAGLVLPKGREDSALKKALKLLDVDDIDITADGDVDGLAEQIEDIKADYPELFARPRASRIDAAPRGKPPVQEKSTAEWLAAALTGAQ